MKNNKTLEPTKQQKFWREFWKSWKPTKWDVICMVIAALTSFITTLFIILHGF